MAVQPPRPVGQRDGNATAEGPPGYRLAPGGGSNAACRQMDSMPGHVPPPSRLPDRDDLFLPASGSWVFLLATGVRLARRSAAAEAVPAVP